MKFRVRARYEDSKQDFDLEGIIEASSDFTAQSAAVEEFSRKSADHFEIVECKPVWNVEFLFSMRCVTRGWQIAADSEEEAAEIMRQCIDKHGLLKDELPSGVIDEALGSPHGWDTISGSDHDYSAEDPQIWRDS